MRQGPSRRATCIQSDKGDAFRFECGEILRVSEILSFAGQSSPLASKTEEAQMTSLEIFAKLYRNTKTNNVASHAIGFSELIQHGEWVQVYGSKNMYLEECREKPSIERNVEGWMYEVICHAGAKIRRGPSQDAEQTGNILKLNETVLINERVIEYTDKGVVWLRLKDGRGWIPNVEEEYNKRLLMRLHVGHQRNSNNNAQSVARKSAGFFSRIF